MWNGLEVDDELPEAGCSWPVIDCTADPNSGSETTEVDDWVEQMAVEILWAASGRQFGVCAHKVRPCLDQVECVPNMIDAWNLVGRGSSFSWDPWGGSMFAAVRCGCNGGCSCTTVPSIELWHRRVRKVTEVKIDGIILPSSSYRLSGQSLLRLDGQPWPTCQDWTIADGVGAWSISYVAGRPVPIGGRIAAGILKRQLGLACESSDDCELPRRVQSITRAGVSIAFLDPMEFLDKGRTGISEVDMWLVSVNPNGLRRRPRVYRHDDPKRQRRVRR